MLGRHLARCPDALRPLAKHQRGDAEWVRGLGAGVSLRPFEIADCNQGGAGVRIDFAPDQASTTALDEPHLVLLEVLEQARTASPSLTFPRIFLLRFVRLGHAVRVGASKVLPQTQADD